MKNSRNPDVILPADVRTYLVGHIIPSGLTRLESNLKIIEASDWRGICGIFHRDPLYILGKAGKPDKGTIIELRINVRHIESNLTWNRPEASRDVLISGRTTESTEG